MNNQDAQVIKPKIKGFICTTAHPLGCEKNVELQFNYASKNLNKFKGYGRALVLGASSGFGLASRICLAEASDSKTIGVYLERDPKDRKTGSAGYYATRAFSKMCNTKGIYSKDFNADGFSDETRKNVANAIKADLGKIDLLVYSLASPRRVDPDTGEVYSSVLKPIGKSYESKSVGLVSGQLTKVSIEPAEPAEVEATKKVMGGEDWIRWITYLLEQDLLEDGFVTVAYSYIGSSLTYPIYRDGTIGAAKDHLLESTKTINSLLSPIKGRSIISVNKALVTQASSAIPVVPLYLSLLFKVMKEKGLHEDCIAQISRLFNDYLTKDLDLVKLDDENRIRIDDWELRSDVQEEVLSRWEILNESNLSELADLEGVKSDYLKLFGFDFAGIDYENPVQIS